MRYDVINYCWPWRSGALSVILLHHTSIATTSWHLSISTRFKDKNIKANDQECNASFDTDEPTESAVE
jgi:hypothetical protein